MVSIIPDLFLDLIKPKTGAISLDTDQRMFLRCSVRFFSMYGCFPRGWGKTWDEFLSLVIISIIHPNAQLSLTAQTKENAVKLLKDKYTEVIRQYPLLANEISKVSFTTSAGEIWFKNGARIDALANSQSSKGLRRHRINIEESVLLNNDLYEDALEPIPEVPRHTCGKLAIVNPEELNKQIHFFSTPGWRGSDEHSRNIAMIKNMIDLKGEIVLGSNWMLASWYGRGSTKSQILQKKSKMSSLAFDQNYGGRWTGTTTGALVNINNLIRCRSLETPELFCTDDKDDYFIGVDVARSENSSNNQSSLVVGKVIRDKFTNRILFIDIVNIINIPNVLNFTKQAIIVKKAKLAYNAKMVIVDGNTIGSGLIDELLKTNYDPDTKQTLECWDTINTDNEPEVKGAEKCLYDMKAQGTNTRVITIFIDMIDSGKLRLLEKNSNILSETEIKDIKSEVMPFFQTDCLFEEIINLKLKSVNGGKSLSVEKVVKRIDKDRYSALAYMLWYVNEFESKVYQPKKENQLHIKIRQPKLRCI